MQTKPQLATCIWLTLLVLSFPAFAEPLPRDLQMFVDQRMDCDHMRGIKEVPLELSKLCVGMDKELAQLKRKYATNSTIMQILNQFEIGTEETGAATPNSTAGRQAA